MRGDNLVRAKVWVNRDLLAALRIAGDGGGNTVAEGLRQKLVLRVDKMTCRRTGFVFAGWTLIDLTEPEHHCLKRLRPACLVTE